MKGHAHQLGLADLRIPPQNKLKARSKDRRGQHAIRISDQYRLCFVWTTQGPADVELVTIQAEVSVRKTG